MRFLKISSVLYTQALICKIVAFCSLCFATLYLCFISISLAQVENKYKTKTFGYWEVLLPLNVKKGNSCHAVSFPLITKSYSGMRDLPYLMISYYNPDMFTISTYAGFIIDKENPLSITANNRTRMLKIARDFYAYTFSSNEDVAIINDMIEDQRMVKVRSYHSTNGVAVDYYSLDGFSKAMKYLEHNCLIN